MVSIASVTRVFYFSILFAYGELQCHLDSKVNPETWASYLTEIGFVFEAACGRNRGIFVTNPPDGHTYNCAKFPEVWNVTGTLIKATQILFTSILLPYLLILRKGMKRMG
jgi:hypothetical protein